MKSRLTAVTILAALLSGCMVDRTTGARRRLAVVDRFTIYVLLPVPSHAWEIS